MYIKTLAVVPERERGGRGREEGGKRGGSRGGGEGGKRG